MVFVRQHFRGFKEQEFPTNPSCVANFTRQKGLTASKFAHCGKKYGGRAKNNFLIS
jgi:hypothetical protein